METINVTNPDESRVVFFCGDVLSALDKQLIGNDRGGIYLRQFATLRPYQGLIQRCNLTLLETSEWIESVNMIHPDDMENWTMKEQVEIVPRKSNSNHLRYRPQYPYRDVPEMVKVAQPNGVGGVVEIEALRGIIRDSMDNVQQFFFSDAVLPKTVKGVTSYITRRMTKTEDKTLLAVGRDMLESCQAYANWLDRFKANIQQNIVALETTRVRHYIPTLRKLRAQYR